VFVHTGSVRCKLKVSQHHQTVCYKQASAAAIGPHTTHADTPPCKSTRGTVDQFFSRGSSVQVRNAGASPDPCYEGLQGSTGRLCTYRHVCVDETFLNPTAATLGQPSHLQHCVCTGAKKEKLWGPTTLADGERHHAAHKIQQATTSAKAPANATADGARQQHKSLQARALSPATQPHRQTWQGRKQRYRSLSGSLGQ
jgi:hypothetical protein